MDIELPPLPKGRLMLSSLQSGVDTVFSIDEVQSYARAAVAAAVEREREAMAQELETFLGNETDWYTSNWNQAVGRCIGAIRARSARSKESGNG